MVAAGAPEPSDSTFNGCDQLVKRRYDCFCHRVTSEEGELVQAERGCHPLLLSQYVADSLIQYPHTGKPRLII